MSWLLSWLISKLTPVLVQLGYEVSGELIAGAITKKLPSLQGKLIIPVTVSAHNKELFLKVKDMPFLYKELEEEVLNDFAGVDIQRIDLKTLEFVETPHGKLEIDERLKRSKKILFLGNAGIGKTTFQRHTILKIISDRRGVECLYPDENPVPFYVPLKVVEDNKPYPILNYLLKSNRLLAGGGKTGLKRLIKLARRRGVFLFIDGYDEAQLLDRRLGTNNLRSELNLMMAPRYFAPETGAPKDPQESDFYDALANCRVWLSSRKEFFERYPLEVQTAEGNKSSNLFALALKGIGEHRLQLIKNIFNKHPKYSALLGAKYYLKQIDRAEDKGLIELSENPLILTIMCYVYVRKVIDKQTYKVTAARNFYDLITECVDLLLIDLDRGKIYSDRKGEGLNEPDIEAELSARNDYVEEKKSFLPYFAAELFLDAKPVFDLAYIKEKAVTFFTNYENSPYKEEILRGLRDDSDSNHNLPVQLTLQGVFVIVDKQPTGELYDFPHTRFREVLASKHFNKHGHDFLLANLNKEKLSELLYVFFTMSGSRDAVLSALLESTVDNPDPDYFGSLLVNCLNQAPPDYDPTGALADFFIRCVNSNSAFSLPLAVVNDGRFTPDEGFLTFLSAKFKESITDNNINGLNLCCDLLVRYNPPLLREQVFYHLKPALDDGNEAAIHAVLGFHGIREYVEGLKNLRDFSQAFFYLRGVYDKVVRKNGGLPFAQTRKQRVCYVVTDPIIRLTSRFIERMGLDAETNDAAWLDEIKFRVFFTNDFLNGETIPLDHQVRRFVLKVARIDYAMYHKIMRGILSFNQSTAKRLKFFK